MSSLLNFITNITSGVRNNSLDLELPVELPSKNEVDSFLDHLNLNVNTVFEDINLSKVNDQIINMTKAIQSKIAEDSTSTEQLTTVIDAMVDPLVCILSDSTIIDFNQAAVEFFGYTYAEAVGQSLNILLPERIKGAHQINVDKFINGEIGPIKGVEVVALHKDGHELPIEISVTLYEKAGTKYLYVFIRDIAERKLYERELQKKSRILEAVSYAGRKLLGSYTENIDKVLARLGLAVDASRVYLFLKNRKDEDLRFRKEWCAEGISPLINEFHNLGLNLASLAPRWIELFQDMQPVIRNTTDISSITIGGFLHDKGTKSILFMPIFVGGKWRGFVGFDDVRQVRSWTDDEVEALKGAAGSIAAAIERYMRDESIKETIRFEQQLLDTLPNIVFVKDQFGKYIKVNKAFLSVLGVTEDQILGKTAKDVFRPEFACSYVAMDDLLFKTKEPQVYRGGVLTYDNMVREGMFFKSPLVDENGVSGLIGTFVDMTDQYRYEHDLSIRNSILSAVFTASALLFRDEWTDNIRQTLKLFCEAIQAQGCAVFKKNNRKIQRMYTWNRTDADLSMPESIINMTISEFITPAIDKSLRDQGYYFGNSETINTKFSLQVHELYRINSLGLFPLVVKGDLWGYLAYGFTDDLRKNSDMIVSSLKLVSEMFSIVLERDTHISAIKSSEALYSKMFEVFPEGYVVHSEDGVLYCNKALLHMLGFNSLSDVKNRQLVNLVDRVNQQDLTIWLNTSGYLQSSLEVQLRVKDGLLLPVELFSYDSYLDDKQVIQTFVRDVSSRKTEKMLKAAIYKALNESSDIVMLTDSNGTIQFVNNKFQSYYQYSLEEAVGKNPRILNSGQHTPAFFDEMWQTILAGLPWEGEIINKKKDGTVVRDYSYITPIMNGSTRPLYFLAMKKVSGGLD